jgi:hypothetical protein
MLQGGFILVHFHICPGETVQESFRLTVPLGCPQCYGQGKGEAFVQAAVAGHPSAVVKGGFQSGVRQEDAEFVAAASGHQPVAFSQVIHDLCDGLQEQVSSFVAEDIVSQFQKIGICRYHADRSVFLAGIDREGIFKFSSVIQSGH